jgi:hypothetical protein
MAHFAQIDENNIVTQVIVVDNSQEHRGQEFINNDLGLEGTWIQTSYNNNFRGKLAALGDTYDTERDLFLEKLPYSSWVRDENDKPVAPVAKPQDGKDYDWNESTVSWVVNPIWASLFDN